MGWLKKQLLKVIEWKDESSNTIVYRFDVPDRYEIMKGSQLIVRESQVAIFVVEGKVADVFEPGRYKLDTENLPVLTWLCNWKYAFENPFKGDVYFVNTKQFTNQKWGTSNPIMMRDADFGVIRLRGFGVYTFRVKDAEKFMKEISSTNKLFTTDGITEQLRKQIVSKVTDVIGESKLNALDLAMNYDELAEATLKGLVEGFEKFGLEISSLTIENLSLPQEVEAAMDKRSSLGIMGDKMGTYVQYQAAEALRDAAKNTGGGLAGAGVGLGAGFGLAGTFASALKDAKDEPKAAPITGGKTAENAAKCPKCGASVSATSKFCPECGEKLNVKKFCPECGAEISAKAKFCPECGKKL